jgi:hypothetical protein
MPLPRYTNISTQLPSLQLPQVPAENPEAKLLMATGETLGRVGKTILEAEQKRERVRSDMLVQERYLQFLVESDEAEQKIQKDPSTHPLSNPPMKQWGAFFDSGYKRWTKGLNADQVQAFESKTILKALEKKAAMQGWSDRYMLSYAQGQLEQYSARAENDAAQHPALALDSPSYKEALATADAMVRDKVLWPDDRAKYEVRLKKSVAAAALGALVRESPEAYQSLRRGENITMPGLSAEQNGQVNEMMQTLVRQADGGKLVEYDQTARGVIEHRQRLAESAENAREKKEEKLRKRAGGAFMADIWQKATNPMADYGALMDAVFQAGPNGAGIPNPEGGENLRLNADEVNQMRATLSSMSREGALKDDATTVMMLYQDLARETPRNTPAHYSLAYQQGKLTEPTFKSLIGHWITIRNANITEAKAELREAKRNNYRTLEDLFGARSPVEVWTDDRVLKWVEAQKDWVVRSQAATSTEQLDAIRADIEDRFRPWLKSKMRQEGNVLESAANGYKTMAEFEEALRAGTVHGVNPNNPRDVAEMRRRLRRLEEVRKKEQEQSEKPTTPPSKSFFDMFRSKPKEEEK